MQYDGSLSTPDVDKVLEAVEHATGYLKKAIDSGKVILDISQCKVGTVELGRYETSKELKDMGVANGYDMTFEAAVTKMMYLLSQFEDPKQVKHYLEVDLRGELTVS